MISLENSFNSRELVKPKNFLKADIFNTYIINNNWCSSLVLLIKIIKNSNSIAQSL